MYQEKKVKAPEEKVPKKIIQSKTINWKSYWNEEYGFEVKHPKDWILTGNSISKNNCHFDIYNLTKDKFTEMIAYIEKGGTNGCLIESISINEIEARNARCSAKWDAENYNGYYLNWNKKFFRIFPWDEKNYYLKPREPMPSNFLECDRIFNQMLSTFKFLK
ncbi:MAG: hypothetical protein QME61_02690 [Patescibacteria group bacterium]|nr:hypothetical protein [Patescibacteria group bacterium]